MIESNYVIVLVVIAFLMGLLLGYFWQKAQFSGRFARLKTNHETLERQLTDLQSRLAEKAEENKQLSDSLKEKENLLHEKTNRQAILEGELKTLQNTLDTERKFWQDKLETQQKTFEEYEKRLSESFENLSRKILDETGKKFAEQNQKNIDEIIRPFKEQLSEFREKVEETNKQHYGRHVELLTQIKNLQEVSRQMSQEALNLTKALKGESKTQGVWGEMILNMVLEKSGLEKGVHYHVQQSFSVQDEHGRHRLQPDVIVSLPDGKAVIIDSKVSLTAYEQWVNSESEAEKQRFLRMHLQSVRQHIHELAQKRYDQIPELRGKSPDFVLMFIPVEPAFSLALKADPQLYDDAFRRNIVLVTPSTLLAVLRIIESMWTNERQKRNTIEIVRQASALLDKFHGFVNDLIQMGKKLDDAKGFYEKSMNKLSKGKGNLIKRVENIRKLGVPLQTKNPMPQSLIDRSLEDEDHSLPPYDNSGEDE